MLSSAIEKVFIEYLAVYIFTFKSAGATETFVECLAISAGTKALLKVP